MELSLLKEKFLGKADVWDDDYRQPEYDRKLTVMFGHKHRGSIRLALGLFHTDKEWEQERAKILRTPMP